MRVALLFFAFQAFALALSSQANSACKDITMVGPAGITMRGDSMILKVKSSTPLPTNTTFDWKVSSGTIVSGQGTDTINVVVPSDSGEPVKATVKLKGLQAPCDEISSEEFGVAVHTCGLAVDDWGKLKSNDEKARLLSASYQLRMNPDAVLLLVLNLAPHESIAEANRRATFIRNFLLNDKMAKAHDLLVPQQKLRIVFTRAEDTRTYVHIFPAADFSAFLKNSSATLRPEDLKQIQNPQ